MRRLHIFAASLCSTLALAAGVVWAASTNDSEPSTPADEAAPVAQVTTAAPTERGEPAPAAEVTTTIAVAGTAVPAGAGCCCATAEGATVACPMEQGLAAGGWTLMGGDAEAAEAIGKLIEELKASGDLSAAGADKLAEALKELNAPHAFAFSTQPFGTAMPAPALSPEQMEELYKNGQAATTFEWKAAPGEQPDVLLWRRAEGSAAQPFSVPLAPRVVEGVPAEAGAEKRALVLKLEGKGIEGLLPHALVLGGTELTDEQQALIEKEVAQALKGIDVEGLKDDVLLELGGKALSADKLAEIESELSGALQGLSLKELKLDGLAKGISGSGLNEDELAKLESELSRLTEETLPQIEERLLKLEKELGEESEAEDAEAPSDNS